MFSNSFHLECPFRTCQLIKHCSVDVCTNSVCIDYPNAVCYSDVCNDCSTRYFYKNTAVTNVCGKFLMK